MSTTLTRDAASEAAAPRRSSRTRIGSGWTPYWFLAPALLWYLIFLVYPMGYSLVTSFHEWDGLKDSWTFIGIANYRKLFLEDETAQLAFRNTVVWTFLSVLLPTSIGLALAIALDSKLPGRVVFRTIFYGPGIVPLVAVGLIWAWMYNPQFGAVNSTLKLLGLRSWTKGWLSNFDTAFMATFVTYLWNHVGFPMVFYLAGLQSIPKEHYEAAALDGANAWQRFRHVTIPGLKETHVIVLSLAMIQAIKVFDLVYTMTYGGPGRATQVLGTWMYFQSFQYYNAGYGAAIAWVIALMILVVAIPYIRRMSRD